ncbi:MAG: class I SAM-dependent DNA methyltransferase [Thermomicrobiales bacterium]
MDPAQHTRIADFIWNIADDVLRDVYVRGKYRDVILPMTVIRRLDTVLEPTKADVLAMKATLDAAGVTNQDGALRGAAKQAFYNTSPFTLKTLLGQPQNLRPNFEAYLDGFSPNVQEILEKFNFQHQIPRLTTSDSLGFLITKFTSSAINLAPHPLRNAAGEVTAPGLDNHGMGTIFEELIRRFNEENNEEAGEHFTPRDVVQLMADLIFLPIADAITDATYLVYDGACGTGGMLTVAADRLDELAAEHGKSVSIYLYGQEVNDETYAITKADLLLKGEGEEAENIGLGSTLSQDQFGHMQFDFMLSNPPYGKSWKRDLETMGGKDGLHDHRFTATLPGAPALSLITRTSDGQMLFLANLLSKMKTDTPLGSRIAEVHNGSALFTGDAGQGESNIRRWIIENDWLEAIIALPLNMFYNTGIATYIWVLSNRKTTQRRGKVQLIDATGWQRPLRRNLGAKNCELGPDDIARIMQAYLTMEESAQSKVFPNAAFGFWKITTERPLRLRVALDGAALSRFTAACEAAGDPALADLLPHVRADMDAEAWDTLGEMLDDYNAFKEAVEQTAKRHKVKLTAKRWNLIRAALTMRDKTAQPVIAKERKLTTAEAADPTLLPDEFSEYVLRDPEPPARGVAPDDRAYDTWGIAYEPDPELRDTEQVPLLSEGGVDGFLGREVLPYAPDAWVDPAKTQIGYEISFTRHFYQPKPLRTLAEIRADIEALQRETDGLLDMVLVG